MRNGVAMRKHMLRIAACGIAIVICVVGVYITLSNPDAKLSTIEDCQPGSVVKGINYVYCLKKDKKSGESNTSTVKWYGYTHKHSSYPIVGLYSLLLYKRY